MKQNLITVFGASMAAAALLVGLAATAQAQGTIFSENFDPLTPGRTVQDGYNFGDTTAHSSGVVSGVGVAGAGWETVNTAASGANGFSGVGGQYQDPTASGNTSLNKSDYTLSFDARRTPGGSVSIQFQTWDGPGFGGAFNGTLSTASDLSLSGSFTHFDINLGTLNGTLTGLGLTGGTIQITMQFNAGGATPYSNTLDVDNFQLTMVPEPSSLALCALGAAGGLAFLRRKA